MSNDRVDAPPNDPNWRSAGPRVDYPRGPEAAAEADRLRRERFSNKRQTAMLNPARETAVMEFSHRTGVSQEIAARIIALEGRVEELTRTITELFNRTTK